MKIKQLPQGWKEVEVINLQVLRKKINRSINDFVRWLNMLYQCRSDEILKTIDYYETVLDDLTEGTRLVLEFNNLKEPIGEVRSCGVIEGLENLPAGKTSQNLNNILRELQSARDYLDIFLSPNLSENEISKIYSLQEELNELERQDCDLLIIKNLKEALSEVESNHYLAGAIISARLIDYIIHFIKENEKLANENINEEMVKKFKEIGLINQKDEQAGETKKFFLDASKSSRDAISHKIEYLPNASECFSLLSYAFRMADLLIKYLEKKNEN